MHHGIYNTLALLCVTVLTTGCIHQHGGFDWDKLQNYMEQLTAGIQSDEKAEAISALSSKLDGLAAAIAKQKEGDSKDDLRQIVQLQAGAFISELNARSAKGGAENLATAAFIQYMLTHKEQVAPLANPGRRQQLLEAVEVIKETVASSTRERSGGSDLTQRADLVASGNRAAFPGRTQR